MESVSAALRDGDNRAKLATNAENRISRSYQLPWYVILLSWWRFLPVAARLHPSRLHWKYVKTILSTAGHVDRSGGQIYGDFRNQQGEHRLRAFCEGSA